MELSLSDQLVSEFLSGLIAVFSIVAVGGALSLVLSGMAKHFPYTRLALVLALAPLTLVRLLESVGSSNLYFYSMIVVLLGITIDGISHLLEPKAQPQEKPEPKSAPVEEEEKEAEPPPGMIVWEKAE
ncbi:hypothetical protein [Pontiella sulfatireligans]|uniref:Uncharacterized protein n=1 Tax=Pontiella sulfatireligans TaxID=2750658 RepID=A0A6C2USF8_9BACT|nr:hypothetical protein [Pontiella sulfatireligans]VGO23270.1 hypothetical protein SCARR_05377 [Pontiella sulfatireligans]